MVRRLGTYVYAAHTRRDAVCVYDVICWPVWADRNAPPWEEGAVEGDKVSSEMDVEKCKEILDSNFYGYEVELDLQEELFQLRWPSFEGPLPCSCK